MLKQLTRRFTEQAVVGIDIGSSAIKVAEVARSKDRLVLGRCAVASRSDEEDVVKLLIHTLMQAEITTTAAAVGLASPEVVVKPFQVPTMPKKELANAIQLEAEQAILNGHSLNDTAVDWHLLSSGSQSTRGLLAVVPRALLGERLDIVRAAGLRPLVADVEGLALWNAFWVLKGRKEFVNKTVLVINVGVKTTNLVIARGSDELLLVRDLQMGGVAFLHAQQEWAAEISDSISYARSKGLRTLDAVFVAGGGGNLGLVAALQSALGVPVALWNPLTDSSIETPESESDLSVGSLLPIAIGLALRSPS